MDFFSKWKEEVEQKEKTISFSMWQNIEEISHHKPQTNWSTGDLIWSLIQPMWFWIYPHECSNNITELKFRYSTQLKNQQSPNKLEIYPEKILTSLLSPRTMSAETVLWVDHYWVR